MSKIIEHAWREFQIAGWCDENRKFDDEMQELICKNVIEVLKVLSNQGHSGSSISYLKRILFNLIDFKPISPLTGGDDEWMEVGTGVFQNKRMGSVFKSKDMFNGQAYWLEGKIFYEETEDGDRTCFTGPGSVVPITFPFNPNVEPEYVKFVEVPSGE